MPAASALGRWMTGAEAIIHGLEAAGVERMFGYPGGAIMPVYDALHALAPSIEHVLVRHEQGAVHAAQGYARATRRCGVCLATSGPGATNLVTGLADARIDSTPLVCIVGQVASHLLGTDAFQETDVINLTAPVTKYNLQVTRAEDLPDAIARAFHIATTGRPGPVLLDITKDAQQGQVWFDGLPKVDLRTYRPVPIATAASLDAAAELLNAAERPLIIAGQGVVLSGGRAALQALAERTGAPVAWTLLGLDAFPTSHPQAVGMVGMHGRYGANVLTNACDVLLAVGMRFDDRVTGDPKRYAADADIIHVDIDPAEIGKIIPAAVGVLGDARDAMERLLPRLATRTHDAWRERFAEHDAIEFEKVVRHDVAPATGTLRMGEVVARLTEATDGEAILVSDVGQHQMITARYGRFECAHTSITSGGLGTMGFGLPAAIGAALGRPDRTVISVNGDGGFQMNLQELGTIMQTGAAVKIVVLDNRFLGMVRQWQELFYERRYSATEMASPDLVRLASAYRIPGVHVADRADLDGAIEAMLACPGPFLLHVSVEAQGNVFPMVPSGASISDIQLEA